MKRRRTGALFLALALTLALAFAPEPAARAATVPCGTIVIPSGLGFAEAGSVNTLHPLFGNGLEIATSTLLYRPLVAIGDDHRFDPAESLAASVAAEAGGRAFTITLKPAVWSDGVPVTTADVLYTWRLIRALGPAYEMTGQGGIPRDVEAIDALDARRLRIRLTRPVAPDWFTATALTQLVPLPAHSWGAFGVAAQQSLQSRTSFYRVVDGAYRLRRLVVGREAEFVPNRRYGGATSGAARLVLRFFNGSDPLEALRTGGVDAAALPPLLDGARGASLPGLLRTPLGSGWLDDAIVLNDRSPSFEPARDGIVRLALARAIDQRVLIRVALHGEGAEQHGFVPASWRSFLPPEERGGASPASFDPSAAAAALDRAGWRCCGSDGVRRRAGRALAFTVLIDADDAPSALLMEAASASLGAIGVRLRIRALEFNQLMARAVGPPSGWDAILFSQPSSPWPDATSALVTGAADNYGGYSDATTDRMIARAIGAGAGDDALWALERRIEREQPVIFLPARSVTVLARPGLLGIGRLVDAVGNWRPERLRWAACGSG